MHISEGRNLLAWLAGLIVLSAAAPVFAQNEASKKPDREDLTIDPATMMQPWKGDLDGMIDRRVIRVLTVPSKNTYFQDRGRQRGATYDAFRLVEQDLNAKLEKEEKLKHLTVRFIFIPVRRDQLLPALVEGKGDIAAANLTVTPERRKLVDFAAPILTDMREVVLTGPASPAVATLDDLAGQEVFVRKSSSYYESLVALNQRFASEKKQAVILKEAPEQLEDEDLIEMLTAGLVAIIVVDKHKADFWKQGFPKIKVHDDMAVRTGSEIAWAIRKDSPELKRMLDQFAATTTSGRYAKDRERILTRYLKNAKYVKNAASEEDRKKFVALIQFFQKDGDKYMIDQFFEKEPMTKLDKALFAFASYNAGPGRVARLRKEAAEKVKAEKQ
jgi:membrane-bound lytic murein transglycosylase MltF